MNDIHVLTILPAEEVLTNGGDIKGGGDGGSGAGTKDHINEGKEERDEGKVGEHMHGDGDGDEQGATIIPSRADSLLLARASAKPKLHSNEGFVYVWSSPVITGQVPSPRAGMTLSCVQGQLLLFGGSG